jgi:nuclear pore complex protein Nup85
MVLSQGDAYELLRHLEEIYSRAEQGGGAQYLGALDKIMQWGKPDVADRPVDVESALGQLQVVRLALARYLARCAVGGSKVY